MQKLPVSPFAIAAIVMLLNTPGCVLARRQSTVPVRTVRRADDEQSIEDRPSSNRWASSAQRARDEVDAIDHEGDSGVYVSGASTAEGWPVAAGSTGVFKMPTSWSTVRAGVLGMDAGGIGAAGIQGGVRVHAPTRFTPYAGLTGDLAMSGLHSGRGYNSSYSHVGNPNLQTSHASGIAAIAPEAGVSYWLNSSTRINAGASYFFAADRPDFLMYGLSLEFVSGGDLSFGSATSSRTSSVPRRVIDDRLFGDSVQEDEDSLHHVVESIDSPDYVRGAHARRGDSTDGEFSVPTNY